MKALRIRKQRGEALSARVAGEIGALLAEDASPAGLGRAAAHAQRAADEAGQGARSQVFTPACGPGCSFCCHVHVDATGPEILAAAAYLARTRSPDEITALGRRLAEHGRVVDGLDDEARWAARIPCALLGPDGRCSIYPARPLRCRAFHSCAVDPCREAFTKGAETDPVTSPALARAHEAVAEGYERALAGVPGLPAAPRRFEGGLREALGSMGSTRAPAAI